MGDNKYLNGKIYKITDKEYNKVYTFLNLNEINFSSLYASFDTVQCTPV